MLDKLIENLSNATPKASVIRWLCISILFALSTFLNEHFELIENIGIKPSQLALIKLIGLYLYMLLTSYQFQQQKNNNENNNNDTKQTNSMARNSVYDIFCSTQGAKNTENS